MTCRDVTITSQTRHFAFEAAILIPKPAVIQLTMTSLKIYVLRNIPSQNKETNVKKLSSFYKRRGKNWKKKTEKRQKIVKIHFWVDGCYGNVNRHTHVIDTGKFPLINFTKSHEIWWLFVWPFKSYNSFMSARVQCAPPSFLRLNRVNNSKSVLIQINLNPNIQSHSVNCTDCIRFLTRTRDYKDKFWDSNRRWWKLHPWLSMHLSVALATEL